MQKAKVDAKTITAEVRRMDGSVRATYQVPVKLKPMTTKEIADYADDILRIP